MSARDDALLDAVRTAWSWALGEPREVVASNAFGNLLVRDAEGAVWRLCPEELARERVASDDDALAALWSNDDFVADWEMAGLVEMARQAHGDPGEGRCYCLKRPAPLGGEYAADNLGTISRTELIAFAGDVAEQIEDLPDGAEIVFDIKSDDD